VMTDCTKEEAGDIGPHEEIRNYDREDPYGIIQMI